MAIAVCEISVMSINLKKKACLPCLAWCLDNIIHDVIASQVRPTSRSNHPTSRWDSRHLPIQLAAFPSTIDIVYRAIDQLKLSQKELFRRIVVWGLATSSWMRRNASAIKEVCHYLVGVEIRLNYCHRLRWKCCHGAFSLMFRSMITIGSLMSCDAAAIPENCLWGSDALSAFLCFVAVLQVVVDVENFHIAAWNNEQDKCDLIRSILLYIFNKQR